jgi:RNA polymerase sigma-70 factor (ECF subfamily)
MDPSSTTRMDPRRERALAARSRLDVSAFGELYDVHLPRIYAFILRRVGNMEAAEDLASKTFERAIAAVREDAIGDEAFGGWLHRAAARAVGDHVARAPRHGPDPTGSRDAPARALAASLDRDALGRALLALPEHHRRIIVLRFLDGLEPEELCSVLECSRATLAVRLHRALAALRKAVARESTDAA